MRCFLWLYLPPKYVESFQGTEMNAIPYLYLPWPRPEYRSLVSISDRQVQERCHLATLADIANQAPICFLCDEWVTHGTWLLMPVLFAGCSPSEMEGAEECKTSRRSQGGTAQCANVFGWSPFLRLSSALLSIQLKRSERIMRNKEKNHYSNSQHFFQESWQHLFPLNIPEVSGSKSRAKRETRLPVMCPFQASGCPPIQRQTKR